MPRLFWRFVLIVWLVSSSMLVVPAAAQVLPTINGCQQGVQPGGALWQVCLPEQDWNGDLVIFTPGYTAVGAPLGLPGLALPDGTSISDVLLQRGFAFATTSYRANGLVVLEGMADIQELVTLFPTIVGQAPARTYLVGVSQGGLITTLLLEQSPELFSGGLALCAPIGNFKRQIDYWGDFRVLFDYFFPGVLPDSPIAIPFSVMDSWEGMYVPQIEQVLAAHPQAAQELMITARAMVDPSMPAMHITTTLNVLWYNVFATNDANARLGGNPYGNRDRWYLGSRNDRLLNRQVARFDADPQALAALAAYETTGNLTVPLVTLHTLGDDVVRFDQALRYQHKVIASGQRRYLDTLPIVRYGHCNFTQTELQAAFGLLLLRVTGHAEIPG